MASPIPIEAGSSTMPASRQPQPDSEPTVKATNAGARSANRKVISAMPAKRIDCTATPARMMRSGPLVCGPLSAANSTTADDAIAPKNARNGSSTAISGRRTMPSSAATPAPALTPISDGSASGLRTTVCISAPATASEAPTRGRGDDARQANLEQHRVQWMRTRQQRTRDLQRRQLRRPHRQRNDDGTEEPHSKRCRPERRTILDQRAQHREARDGPGHTPGDGAR